MFTVEAPVWTTPEYWGGVSVDSPSTYNPSSRGPRAPSERVQGAAVYVLATALESVIKGDFEEEAAEGGSFDPGAMGLEDGTVVLLERERLTRMSYEEVWPERTSHTSGDLPEDAAQFADYWRSKSDDLSPAANIEVGSFGMTGRELSYQRSMQWGVLVSQRGGKAVLSWEPFGFYFASDIDGDSVSFRPHTHDVDVIPGPIALGRTEASRKGPKGIIIPRSIERTTAVRLVHAEGAADYDQAYRNTNPLIGPALTVAPDAANLYRGAEIMIAGTFMPRG